MGQFRHRITVLELVSNSDTSYIWEPVMPLWSMATRKSTNNIFSSVGLSAESWEFRIRAGSVTMDNAIFWDGHHHLITAIDTNDRQFWTLQTARVQVLKCQADPVEKGPFFPAVLTEKYIRHEQLEPLAVNTTAYVLVTPKVIDLEEGRLVDVAGTAYEVQKAHRLDRWKNEFEIVRKADL